jgi:hypothetical protein
VIIKNKNDIGIVISDTVKFDGPIELGDTIKAKDAQFSSNVTLQSALHFSYMEMSNHHWDVFLDPKTIYSSDLILKSKNNTTITFTDDFQSELLNFTGKHRCNMKTGKNKKYIDSLQGRIVSSKGKYVDLCNKKTIRIDEAIPVVKLCKKSNDKSVFGVVCNMEENDEFRKYKIGNLQFIHHKEKNDKKVVVNSHGEGAIWITNVNGNLRNGDLITTSYVPGYGMKQNDNIVKNYTVAKITCNCSFNLKSKTYVCKKFKYKNIVYKKAFVGCIYKI